MNRNIFISLRLQSNDFHVAPKPTVPICVEPQEPECGFGQTMKTVIDTDGCHKFICRTYNMCF